MRKGLLLNHNLVAVVDVDALCGGLLAQLEAADGVPLAIGGLHVTANSEI